jgi:hypothetical protein
MFTPYLMRRRKYYFPRAGGGAYGMDIGTAPINMIEDGVTIGEILVFTNIFMPAGEMISGIIGGEDNHGDFSVYITVNLMTIGVTGKEPSTGMVVDLVTLVKEISVIPAVDSLVEANPE